MHIITKKALRFSYSHTRERQSTVLPQHLDPLDSVASTTGPLPLRSSSLRVLAFVVFSTQSSSPSKSVRKTLSPGGEAPSREAGTLEGGRNAGFFPSIKKRLRSSDSSAYDFNSFKNLFTPNEIGEVLKKFFS